MFRLNVGTIQEYTIYMSNIKLVMDLNNVMTSHLIYYEVHSILLTYHSPTLSNVNHILVD